MNQAGNPSPGNGTNAVAIMEYRLHLTVAVMEDRLHLTAVKNATSYYFIDKRLLPYFVVALFPWDFLLVVCVCV